ncbi:MAG TPA: cation:proton antiporter [Candidatus Baltobacteraceae bacterium]|nr:cation:proton antiporter [Candidatus Baltobacteraceae bacterium]
MKLWQIAVLVVAGLAVGEARPGLLADTFRTATLYVFLPALIFEAAWQLDARLIVRAWRPIVLLAIPGVAITAALIASVAHVLGGLGLVAALVLGAALSATDPVAVVAIFRKLNVPPLLATIVECESLLNDAVAVIIYRSVIAAVTVAASASAVERVSLLALLGSLLSVGVGIAIAYLGSFALRKNVPVAVQTLVTLACAYAAYFASDSFAGSGIFAVIACGVTLRALERRYVTVDMQDGVERAWHYASIVANATLFFLVGSAVEMGHIWAQRGILAWTIAAALAARFLLAYGLLSLAPRLARSWKTVVRLAGVRGALSLALALGVPASVPQRGVIVDVTFAVVIVTILIGSLTYERRIEGLDL